VIAGSLTAIASALNDIDCPRMVAENPCEVGVALAGPDRLEAVVTRVGDTPGTVNPAQPVCVRAD